MKDTHEPRKREVDQAIGELLSYWTNVNLDQDTVVGQVTKDLPTDEHRQRRVLVGRKPGAKKLTPVEHFVASLDGDWLLVNEVAERLGMSESWVRVMSKKPEIKAPRHSANFGRIKVGLYDEQDVAELQAVIDSRTVTENP